MGKKIYLDRRFTTNKGPSILGVNNSIDLGAWVTNYLTLSPLPTSTLAETLVAGNITGGSDIMLTSGDVIVGAGTNNQIDLVSSNAWQITNAAGAFTSSYVYGDISSAYLAFGLNSNFIASAASIDMSHTGGGMIGSPLSYMSVDKIGIADNGGVLVGSVFVQDNSTAATSSIASLNNSVFINTGATGATSIITTGLDNTVIVAGKGVTAKTAETLYTNQISLQQSGNTFDCILKSGANTADNEIDFPLTSGRALIQRVVVVSSTPVTAADGEVMMVDTTAAGGVVTVNLPVCTTNQRITVKNIAGANNVILDGNGAETIDGLVTYTVPGLWNFVTVVGSGSNWFVVAEG